ncbi:MAG TPA: class I SAM-dependent methyltransferase [Herpetosiphonaceae bacterium]|nr:class I SAM-dependent methyltransferase [Herpetosiphonaceae bacterium]
MTHEVSRSHIFDNYTNHCGQFNSADPSTLFPDYDLNLRALLPADRTAEVLDFGCGRGQFLTYLRARGYARAMGVDLSRSQIEYCHAQGLANAYFVEDSLAFLAEHRNQCSAIVALDVIEHIPKMALPWLKALCGALQPGGTFIMRVPNIAAAVGPWTRYMDITHELSFDERSAAQALEMAGFGATSVAPLKTHYRRRWLGHGFEFVRRIFYMALKAVYVLQAPGTKAPAIFTILIFGMGKKGSNKTIVSPSLLNSRSSLSEQDHAYETITPRYPARSARSPAPHPANR